MSAAESACSLQYMLTLDDYDEFNRDMSQVSDDWQQCKRLIDVFVCVYVCGRVYRQSVSAGESACSLQYMLTLDDYDEFDRDMSLVSDDWQQCKRLIEVLCACGRVYRQSVSAAESGCSLQYMLTLDDYDEFDRDMSQVSDDWQQCKRLIGVSCMYVCVCGRVYRQSVSASESACSLRYMLTLDDYDEFDRDMSQVSDDWQQSKRLIEAYNEQQVSIAATAFLCFSVFVSKVK